MIASGKVEFVGSVETYDASATFIAEGVAIDDE